MAEELVTMTKNNETIHVHPLAVEDHKSLGWKIVEAQPAVEKPVEKKADGKAAKKADAAE